MLTSSLSGVTICARFVSGGVVRAVRMDPEVSGVVKRTNVNDSLAFVELETQF